MARVSEPQPRIFEASVPLRVTEAQVERLVQRALDHCLNWCAEVHMESAYPPGTTLHAEAVAQGGTLGLQVRESDTPVALDVTRLMRGISWAVEHGLVALAPDWVEEITDPAVDRIIQVAAFGQVRFAFSGTPPVGE